MPLGIAGTALRYVLGVVGSDDLLAGLGMIHLGLFVREEPIESPIEYARGEERVDVSNGKSEGI